MPSLEVAREHVLMSPDAGGGNPALASAAELVGALRNGHSYCGLDSLYPSDGFSFRISTANESGGPGDVLRSTVNARLQISVPSGSSLPLIKIFRDGRKIDEQETRAIDEPVPDPGATGPKFSFANLGLQAGDAGLFGYSPIRFTLPLHKPDFRSFETFQFFK